jgi:hypothetical protein
MRCFLCLQLVVVGGLWRLCIQFGLSQRSTVWLCLSGTQGTKPFWQFLVADAHRRLPIRSRFAADILDPV